MSILVNKDSKIMVQGLTGRQGSFHAQQCIDYGTQIVAGVTPGRGGEEHIGVPVLTPRMKRLPLPVLMSA